MIDILPRRFIYSRVRKRDQKHFCLLISSLLCLSFGFFGHYLNFIFNALNVFKSCFSLEHLCPFCGGTRAFMDCCEGNYHVAAQSSLIGCYFFLWTLLTLLMRPFVFFVPLESQIYLSLNKVFHWLDSTSIQLSSVLLIFACQLLLNFYGILKWAVLS